MVTKQEKITHAIQFKSSLTNNKNLLYQTTTGINDSSVAAYYKLMVESAVNLGAEKSEAETQMLQVLNFETQLANVSRSPMSGGCNDARCAPQCYAAPVTIHYHPQFN